jgi:hypothetical protein
MLIPTPLPPPTTNKKSMSNTIQPFPLSQLGAMADKQNLACIAGTITSIWKPKTGTNSTGEWSIQNATLKGIDGIEVGLWLKDREELPQSTKGQFVILEARQGEKGLSGLYVMDDDYKGKVTRKIKVTPTASISYSQAATTAPPQQQHQSDQEIAKDLWNEDTRSQQSPPPPQQQDKPQTNHRHASEDAMREAERTITQITNLHLTCSRAVIRYEAPMFKQQVGQDMTESMVQGAIASVFIESCRNGLYRNMPTSKIQFQD